jgi:hypothetical protein
LSGVTIDKSVDQKFPMGVFIGLILIKVPMPISQHWLFLFHLAITPSSLQTL